MDAGATRPRPVRADVVASYDLGVDGYVDSWSAIILPPAQAVVAALGIRRDWRVVDVGTGAGALVPSIEAAAPNVKVVGLDVSEAMLHAARARTGAAVARADALALPVRDGAADALLLAYVLFHLSDPEQAVLEAARVLRAGGTIGTVTWAGEVALPAYTVWDETLAAAGASALPSRRSDAGLDSPEGVGGLLTSCGFDPARIWRQSLHHQWTPESYCRYATASGSNRLRLRELDDATRADALTRARQRLSSLPSRDLAWSGEVVCAVARRRERRSLR